VRVSGAVRVAEGVVIENSEIGPNVTIESGSVIRNATLRDTIIGESCTIENAKLHDSLIGDHVVVSKIEGVVSLGDHSTVE
jgi:glucose-1-phosphate thymidylyltransferase